jgi:hypothetical protein
MEYRVPNRCPNLDDYDGNFLGDGRLLRKNEFPNLWNHDEDYVRPVKKISIEEYRNKH